MSGIKTNTFRQNNLPLEQKLVSLGFVSLTCI